MEYKLVLIAKGTRKLAGVWSSINHPYQVLEGRYTILYTTYLDLWRSSVPQPGMAKHEPWSNEPFAGIVGISETGRSERGKLRGAWCKNTQIPHAKQKKKQKLCTYDVCRRIAQIAFVWRQSGSWSTWLAPKAELLHQPHLRSQFCSISASAGFTKSFLNSVLLYEIYLRFYLWDLMRISPINDVTYSMCSEEG